MVAIAPGTDRSNEDLLTHAIVDFLSRNNISFVYPVEEFRRGGDSLCIPIAGHFSKEGNKRFAEHLYKLIISLEPSLARPQ